MKSSSASLGGCVKRLIALCWFCFAVMALHADGTVTNGYISAVLRSECANAPTPPPPVGTTAVGTNYVIMTVADADPRNLENAQQVATDAIFLSLMASYCDLPITASNCIARRVQWSITTYDVNGNPVISGCAASGCQYHSCAGFESGPPIILAQPSDQSVNSGQTATFSVDISGAAPLYYQWMFDQTNVLAGATNSTLVLPNARTNQTGTYQVVIYNSLGGTNSRAATLTVNPGPAATNGYITAVLRTDCGDAPTPPPPVGIIKVGTNYVIMTVADADPWDWQNAQQLATDGAFLSLMSFYCTLPITARSCIKRQVQWNVITYDVNGNPITSGCAASGCQYHSCAGSESGLPIILAQPSDQWVNSGQTATFSVDISGAAPLYYQWMFDQTNVLAGATNSALVLPNARTNQAGTYEVIIYNTLGSTNSRVATLTVNPGPAATNGYVTAVLRSGCANAPTPPPPVGTIRMGTNYVIMSVADANPLNWQNAQQVAADGVFSFLMPFYCALPSTGSNCLMDQVQWNIITYDANGNPVTSGCAASGCQFHLCAGGTTQILPTALMISLASASVGLSWSTMASDFVLEQSTNMVDWNPVTWPGATSFDTISVQMPPQGSGGFFRLRHK
ncbi:MAG: immunoglobulin domain-containing protein [Verrucomicrobiota bacterium]